MQEKLDKFILDLIQNFEKIIPKEEKERTELIQAFKEYLYMAVKTIQESSSKNIDKDEDFIKLTLNNIVSDLSARDINSMKQYLIADDAYEEIRKKSIEIFEVAKNAMLGKKANLKYDKTTEIEEMKNSLKNVKEYNQENAENLISEAIVDLTYLDDPNAGCLSIRLYHFKDSIKNLKGEER